MTKRNPTFLDRTNLVHEWLLDGNWNDSAWSIDLTSTNITWNDSNRWYTKELATWNWTSSYLVNTTSQNIGIANAWSIVYVVKWNSADTSLQVIFEARNYPTDLNNYFQVRKDGTTWKDKIFVYDSSGSNKKQYESTNAISTSDYEIRSWTWDWTDLKHYVNWVEDTTVNKITDSSLTMTNTNRKLGIWNDSAWAWVNHFNWDMQLFRLYDTALSVEQQKRLYLEWLRKLWPSLSLQYPELFEWAKFYVNFHGDWDDIIWWIKPTEDWTPADTTDQNGVANQAKTFDGVNESYDYGNNMFKPWSWNFTVLTVFKYTSTTAWMHFWSSSNTSPYGRCRPNQWWTWEISFELFDWSTNPNMSTSWWWYNDWNWHSCFARRKASNSWDLYIDKAQVATSSTSMWSVDANSPFLIAERNWGWYYNWDISITIYWDRALSDSECDLIHDLLFKRDIYPFAKYDLPNLRDWLILDISKAAVGGTYDDQSWNGNNWTSVASVTDTANLLNNEMWMNWTTQYITTSLSYWKAWAVCFSLKPNVAAWTITDTFFWASNSWSTDFLILQNWSDWNSYWWLKVGWTLYRFTISDAFPWWTWKFFRVVFTWDDSTWVYKLYWNMELKWSGTWLATITPISEWVYIWSANVWWSSSNPANCSIANVKIYNRLLSYNEVQQDFYSNFITN